MSRASWDQYFIDIAQVASARSTCTRLAVGAVIVRDKTILSTGYNGSIRGAPHCTDGGCIVENDHCIATVHAEANAIVQAAKNGVGLAFATAYVTVNPCLNCYKLLVNVGVKKIVYGKIYKPVDYGVLKLNANCTPEMLDLSTGVSTASVRANHL